MKVVIATHNGVFHADDVFGCAILKTIWPEATFVRTRDQDLLDSAYIRVDVGGKYDPHTRDYDHHQNTSLQAACNLVWASFWPDFLIEVHGHPNDVNVEAVMAHVKKTLLDPISGLDCNFTQYAEENPIGVYKTVGQAIMDFNRVDMGDKVQLSQFEKAVEFASQVLRNCTYQALQRERHLKTIQSGTEMGEFALVLDAALPYNEFRTEIPATRKLLVYPDSTNDGYCVVSLDVADFNLSNAAGEGLIFAHKVGFFTKWQTKYQAVEFAARRSEVRSMEIDTWSFEQNNGNGARYDR